MSAQVAVEPEVAVLPLSELAFEQLANRHRRELMVHCYRMLGSLDDAEDAVQETFARAWQARNTFREPGSVRAWLYRIATNVSLDLVERRGRIRSREEMGVDPLPTSAVEDAASGPEGRYDAHEAISLAFLTCLQRLPARQRAVLLLRDVLAWRATEVAGLLDVSVPAVNSALHRARSTMADSYRPAPRALNRESQALLARYVRAWEASDVPALVDLLREDAVLSMPPAPPAIGARAIGELLAGSVLRPGAVSRLVPVRANDGPAFVVYAGSGNSLVASAVVALAVDGAQVVGLRTWWEARVVARFAQLAPLAG